MLKIIRMWMKFPFQAVKKLTATEIFHTLKKVTMTVKVFLAVEKGRNVCEVVHAMKQSKLLAQTSVCLVEHYIIIMSRHLQRFTASIILKVFWNRLFQSVNCLLGSLICPFALFCTFLFYVVVSGKQKKTKQQKKQFVVTKTWNIMQHPSKIQIYTKWDTHFMFSFSAKRHATSICRNGL